MRAAFGEFTFDDETRQLLRNGKGVPVAPRVFDLLGVLLANRPRALSKSDLMDALWPKTFVSESNLASLVNDLRAALGDDARNPTWIRTVYGFGYAFSGEGASPGEAAPSFPRHRLLWAGREVGLKDGVIVLGRDASADLLVVDGSVSRRHARIEVRAQRVTLEDLDSKNGTFHGGRRITSPVALSDGDEIRLGSVLLRFVSASSDGSTLTRD
ncbi:MAG TPA: FHA domain-containing protein [Thermoanaerobaculia bacterium]|nr:FHA domain-containing protein [Thermoanaerobaculia bacterium]